MITIGSNAFCCCRSNRSNGYTCPLHWLTLRSSPVWRGDIKVFAFIGPSSNDGYLPVMCESQNFESIFGPLAILHARSRPRLQLHVSPSCCLRHVTKPTVTYMTDFLVLFAMSFLDTRILIRKCSNIPTFNLRGDRC